MSRIKFIRPAAILLSALLMLSVITPAGAADAGFRPDDEDLYFSALNEEIKDDVRTTEVRLGDFSSVSSCRGEIVYENVSYCVNSLSEGNVRYVRMLVSNGDWVKRGDPLVEVTASVETADIEALKVQIESEEQNLDEYMAVSKELMDKYIRIMRTSSGANERRMAELLYDRLAEEYDAEYESRTKQIEELVSYLDTLENSGGPLYITAGIEGEVRDIYRYRSGDTIRSWGYICTIVDTRYYGIRVAGGVEGLTYNMPVKVTQAQNQGSVTLDGRVSTCKNSVLSANLIGNTDYIEITGDMSLFKYGSDVTISFRPVDLTGVTVVDKNAVDHDNMGNFVYVYSNGKSLKRYIQTGGVNATVVWVVSGLKEGDRIVIK